MQAREEERKKEHGNGTCFQLPVETEKKEKTVSQLYKGSASRQPLSLLFHSSTPHPTRMSDQRSKQKEN